MSHAGEALAAAANALIGVPFRLGGRTPAHGLDCIGLVAASLAAIGRDPGALPHYRLRQWDLRPFQRLARRSGLLPCGETIVTGDVLLLRPSPEQWHLAIASDAGGVLHAHAGLGRVVHSPPPVPWPIALRWRLS